MIKHISTLTKEHILDTIQEFSRDNDKIIIISGFITLAGFNRIENAIDPQKIDRIIVGVFTEGANRAFEYIAEKYPKIRLFIYKFLTKEGDVENPSFTPILHAKIIAGYKSRLLRWAYTGSANITDYALNNSNIESGIFLKHKNKELDEINKTIQKINKVKTNLIDFKKSEGLFFIPEEKFIHQVKAFITVKVRNTYLVVINEELTDQNHDFIGIYCNDKDILARLRINDSILFYFLKNKKLILNRVRNLGEKVFFPMEYISLYLENIDNNGFKMKSNYNGDGDPSTFILVEKLNDNNITQNLLKKIGALVNQNASDLFEKYLSVGNVSFLNRIIWKMEKSRLKPHSLNYLRNNKIVDLTELEIEKGEIITLQDLLDKKEVVIFNRFHSLTYLTPE